MYRDNAGLIKYFLLLLFSSIGSVIILIVFEYVSLVEPSINLVNEVLAITVLFIYSIVLSIKRLSNPSHLNPLKCYKLGFSQEYM